MAYDDLIAKLRGNINNGFSIGMKGRDRVALADLANLQAKLNPGEAEGILGSAADEIGFGSGGNSQSSLAALMKLGNDVQFRAKGGPVLPGQPYIVGEKGPELMVPEQPGYIQPHTNLTDFMAKGQQPPNIPGLANPEQVVAYTQGSNGYNPIRTDANGVTNWDKKPMSLAQVNALDTGWNALPVNQGPQQDINTIPVSAGGRVGTYANLADLNKGAIQDKLDAGNAMYGQNPYTMTQQERGGNETQSLASLRSGLNRADTQEMIAGLNASTRQQIADANNQMRRDIEAMRGQNRLQISINNGANKNEQRDFKNESAMRKEFLTLPEVKDFPTISTQSKRAMAALNTRGGSNVAVDQSIITVFNKMLDPSSVVRESEYARTPQDLSLLSRIKGKWDKVQRGGAGLDANERAALGRMIQSFNEIANDQYNSQVNYYSGLAKEYGYNPRNVVRLGGASAESQSGGKPKKPLSSY